MSTGCGGSGRVSVPSHGISASGEPYAGGLPFVTDCPGCPDCTADEEQAITRYEPRVTGSDHDLSNEPLDVEMEEDKDGDWVRYERWIAWIKSNCRPETAGRAPVESDWQEHHLEGPDTGPVEVLPLSEHNHLISEMAHKHDFSAGPNCLTCGLHASVVDGGSLSPEAITALLREGKSISVRAPTDQAGQA